MTKRTNRPRKPRDEESSDEVSGMVSKEVWIVIFMSLRVVTLMYYEPWGNCCECIFYTLMGLIQHPCQVKMQHNAKKIYTLHDTAMSLL